MSRDCTRNNAMQRADWRQVRLSDVLLAMRNGTIAEQVSHATDFPVSRIETISSGHIDREKVGYLKRPEPSFLLRVGDILYSHINSVSHIGKSAIYRGGAPLYHGMNLMLLRANAEVVLPEYLARTLEMPRSRAYARRECKPAINQASLGQTQIGSLPLLLPSVTEQRMITHILDAMDEEIRSTERLLFKLGQAQRSLLNDVLTRGIAESGQLRDVRIREHFKESELGIIPRSWSVKRLTELGHIRSGTTPSRSMSSRYFAGDGLPWVKTLDLNEGLIFDTDERVTDTAIRECSCPLLRPGTVLLAMYGGWAQIGRTGLLAVAGTINQAISSIEVADTAVLPEYLLIALQHGRDRWKAVGASTRKDPNITRQDVLAFEVPVPPIREQEFIVEVNAVSNSRLTTERRNLRKLRLLKQGMMDDLLSGQVRVGAA
jgi:type I restriction enzyme, S subunit